MIEIKNSAGVVIKTIEGADLRGANLYGANLCGANLYRADLGDANLCGADLRDAKNLSPLVAARLSVAPAGDLIVWKKAGGYIVKLLIPAAAARSSATTRKCRAEYAKVLEIDGADRATSERGGVYIVGETVRPDKWDTDRWTECSHGIHFFLTREEAEDWV